MRYLPFPSLSLLPALLAATSLTAQSTVRVSVDSNGVGASSGSASPAISADGRFVAFYSSAGNLVPGDTNARADVFVRDTHTGTTTRVSVATGGAQANHDCLAPVISRDGRFVLFESSASNLVAGDGNGLTDVFVHDRLTGTTTCVSVSPAGTTGFSGHSRAATITDDGRFVAFHSGAQDLVAGDTNSVDDIFVRDRQTNTTTRVSVRSDGSQTFAPSTWAWISGDGTSIAFHSHDSLVPSDPWATPDMWVKNLVTGSLTIASLTLLGTPAATAGSVLGMSPDGRLLLISSGANDLVANDLNPGGDYFVRDMLLGTTELVSLTSTGGPVLGTQWSCAMSDDGRKVVFAATAANVVPGDTNAVEDAFVRDRWLGTVTRVSLTATGAQCNNGTRIAVISGEGRHVAFTTSANNVVAGDTNGVLDVFLRDTEVSGCGTGGTASTYGGTFQTGNATFGFQVTGADPAALLVLDLGFASPGIECGSCVLTVPVILAATPNVGGTGQYSFPVPNDPSYIGPSFEFQWLSLFTVASPCPLLPNLSATGRVRFSAVL
ncbi:MAG: PD40 domain-containing protein [Planctomycetes bacterium]|nr:PD40 domain-containing protein [Planctomycetota bacterium]